MSGFRVVHAPHSLRPGTHTYCEREIITARDYRGNPTSWRSTSIAWRLVDCKACLKKRGTQR